MSTPLRRYYRGHTLATMRDEVAATSRTYHFDHQGTTQCLTDSTGAVTDRFASDAWGVQVKRTGTSVSRQWYIGNSGYYRPKDGIASYVRARYMDSPCGRWISQDPLIIEGHTSAASSYQSSFAWRNLDESASDYLYCGNNPIVRYDPSGLRFPGQGGPLPPWPDQPVQPVQPDIVFGGNYGKCCGASRSYSSPASQWDVPPPWNTGIDCIDHCCCQHDFCLRGVEQFCHGDRPRCDRNLCHCAQQCTSPRSFSGCWQDRNPGNCQFAAIHVQLYYCYTPIGTFGLGLIDWIGALNLVGGW